MVYRASKSHQALKRLVTAVCITTTPLIWVVYSIECREQECHLANAAPQAQRHS